MRTGFTQTTSGSRRAQRASCQRNSRLAFRVLVPSWTESRTRPRRAVLQHIGTAVLEGSKASSTSDYIQKTHPFMDADREALFAMGMVGLPTTHAHHSPTSALRILVLTMPVFLLCFFFFGGGGARRSGTVRTSRMMRGLRTRMWRESKNKATK